MRIAKIALASILISSCNNPEIRDLRQFNVRLVTEECGDRICINMDESACFSRLYRHSADYLGSVGSDQELDVRDCHDVIGYKAPDYVDLSDFFEEVRRQISKKKRSKRKNNRMHKNER